MKRRKLLFTILMVFAAVCTYAAKPTNAFQEDKTYHGFRLLEKRFVPEVNADCLYFIHEGSGARLMKIAADDPNKLFNIAFKTLPDNSTGVAHIMEHSVLNGSRNFPVKSPFSVLVQGSLNTFLNAMTGADITTYPVASMNPKDYFNLMHVYLDAVFFPRIYDDPRIFLQEAWHYELDDVDSDLVYKGVVFNEMKGAYSGPYREQMYQVNKALFPSNTYGVCSGGYPSVIPELTYEEFLDFHRTYYHPSNSYITLYGNADLDQELAFIHEKYLSGFQPSGAHFELTPQPEFASFKELELPYAVTEGSDVKDNTFLSVNFVAGTDLSPEKRMALGILADMLVNNQTAPLRLALQQAGIGKNVGASLSTGKQSVFSIRVENANREDVGQFRKIVFDTMREMAHKGFDKEILQGIINRREFNLREGNTSNKGLMYVMNAYLDWFFADDPFAGLEFESSLAYVKKAIEEPLLESLMQQILIDNNHGVLLALYPQPGLEGVNTDREREKLAAYKATLSQQELQQLVEQTRELKAFQQRQDSPQDLATVPLLSLQDISPEIAWYPLQENQVKDVPVFHYDVFTNDIVYSSLYFDMRVLPQELIPYARLLSAIIRQVDTEKTSYGQMDNEFNVHTGAFYTYLETFRQNQSEDDILPMFVAVGKATPENTRKYFELVAEVLNDFSLQDRERVKTVIARHQAGVEAQMNNDGVGIAIRRLTSYYSRKGMFDELTNGHGYYQFITRLNNNFDEQYEDLAQKLKQTAGLLFNANNMKVQVTGNKSNYKAASGGLKKFIAALPESKPQVQQWDLKPMIANEGILTASKVQYVAQGFDYKKLGYNYDGKMRVLNQILSRGYLQNKIRVMGGAYGGWAAVEPTGNLYFVSYRDPNLKETLDNYKGGFSFLESFQADEKEMTRFIIGTISGIDRPQTPNVQGSTAMKYYFENISPEELQAERQAILATTADDIRGMAGMVGDMLQQDAYCVYGNEGKIKENESLFRKLFPITE